MPNIKSQFKSVKTSAKQNAINSAKKTTVKNVVKKYTVAIDNKDIATAEALLPNTVSVINSAASDGIYHKNTAARKVSSLYKLLNNLKAEGSVSENA